MRLGQATPNQTRQGRCLTFSSMAEIPATTRQETAAHYNMCGPFSTAGLTVWSLLWGKPLPSMGLAPVSHSMPASASHPATPSPLKLNEQTLSRSYGLLKPSPNRDLGHLTLSLHMQCSLPSLRRKGTECKAHASAFLGSTSHALCQTGGGLPLRSCKGHDGTRAGGRCCLADQHSYNQPTLGLLP